MQRILLGTAALLLAGTLTAQVTIGVLLPQEQFLPGEAVPVSVRITNFSGQTLHMGQDNTWLRFSLEANSGYPVRLLSDPAVKGDFDLENAMVATKKVDITPHFEQLQPGTYHLRVLVQPPGAQEPLAARTKLEILNGTVRWEQRFGRSSTQGGQPEIRVYALQQANNLQQLKLYFRLTSLSQDRVLKLFALGPLLTFSETEQQIDRESRLHLLYQYGARSFYYYVISPDGDIVTRETHDYEGASRPGLRINEDGKIVVRGGMRRAARDDIPPANPSPALNPTPPASTPPPAAPGVPSVRP